MDWRCKEHGGLKTIMGVHWRSRNILTYTVLPATRHKRTQPALTPTMQAGTWFTYPGGMEGWVDLVDLIAPAGSRTSDLSITRPMLNHCTTKTSCSSSSSSCCCLVYKGESVTGADVRGSGLQCHECGSHRGRCRSRQTSRLCTQTTLPQQSLATPQLMNK